VLKTSRCNLRLSSWSVNRDTKCGKMYLLKVNERIDKHDNGLQTILTNLNSPNQMHCRVICQLVLHFQLILHIGTSECKLNKHSLHQSPSIGEHLNDVLGLHRVFSHGFIH
jgi:hypothetical protein